MIIVMEKDAGRQRIEEIKTVIRRLSLDVHESVGKAKVLLGVVGQTHAVDVEKLESLPGIEKIMRVQHPFKLSNREFKPENSVIKVGNRTIGGEELLIIAGPCAVEHEEQIRSTAAEVRARGAHMLRGGAFKPRTSPYGFQGLGMEGLELLQKAKADTDLPVVTEIISADLVEAMEPYVDVFQVGARNMQNFQLLKALGEIDKPVILKRGMSATIEEFLMAAEYILAAGNPNVILCERGIRSFEKYTRNTLDISAIPIIKQLSHLPIIVDPSHSGGKRELVVPLSLAAIAAGADGIIVEVHYQPDQALCDGAQSLDVDGFGQLMDQVGALAKFMRKRV